MVLGQAAFELLHFDVSRRQPTIAKASRGTESGEKVHVACFPILGDSKLML